MQVTAVLGTKNGVNKSFSLGTAGQGLVLVIHAGKLLKRGSASPGPNEYFLNGLALTLGTAPLAGAMLYAYIQPVLTEGLREISVTGMQDNLNTVFQLGQAIPPGTNLLLLKNGFALEEVAGPPSTVQYQVILNGTEVVLGQAPLSTDQLRAFITAPATAVLTPLAVSGSFDSATTRFGVPTYMPPAGRESVLLVILDGQVQNRTLLGPLAAQYQMIGPQTFLLGIAPAAGAALEVLLIGTTPYAVSAFPFTLGKLSRKMGIFLSRALDEAECEEIAMQAYRECMETYQWSFLMVEGAFATAAPKTNGTVAVAQFSHTVAGTGTSFSTDDIGKRFQLTNSQNVYTVTNVNPSSQLLEITPGYVDPSLTGQGYQIVQTVYKLGVDAEYIFSMTGRSAIREQPLSVLNAVDPLRMTTADVPCYFAYAGKSNTGELQVELYPTPSASSVIRYSAIRHEEAAEAAQVLRGVESIVLNVACAQGCRTAAVKGPGKPDVWLQLIPAYEAKAAQILERLDALDWTRSDVAKVQGWRDTTGPADDGWYQATHDAGGGDDC